MSASPPSAGSPTPAASSHGPKSVARWVVEGGLAVGLILATYQCITERNNATRAAHQSQVYTKVSAFRETGKVLDRATAKFNDAVAAHGDATKARDDFRSALIDHAAQTEAMSNVFGGASTQLYMSDLRRLQVAIEKADEPTRLPSVISALSSVLVRRSAMASAAEAKA